MKYNKQTYQSNVFKNDCACIKLSFYLLYVNGNAKKWLYLLVNGTQFARPKNGVAQYARPK